MNRIMKHLLLLFLATTSAFAQVKTETITIGECRGRREQEGG